MIFRRMCNFLLCLRYPFYRMHDLSGAFLGYDYTWYDCLDKGWKKAFGKHFSKDLKKQLKKDNQLKTFRFSDIKEKWGSLHIYTQGCSEECWKLFDRYEELSSHICIECGRKAHYKTTGYILPYCEKHLKKLLKDRPFTKYEAMEIIPIDDVAKVFYESPTNWCKEYIIEKYGNDAMFISFTLNSYNLIIFYKR